MRWRAENFIAPHQEEKRSRVGNNMSERGGYFTRVEQRCDYAKTGCQFMSALDLNFDPVRDFANLFTFNAPIASKVFVFSNYTSNRVCYIDSKLKMSWLPKGLNACIADCSWLDDEFLVIKKQWRLLAFGTYYCMVRLPVFLYSI